MNVRKTLLLAMLMGCLSISTSAAPTGGRIMSGQQAERRVTALTTNVRWYDSLPKAEAAAKKSGKPIVWIHMLGQLTGDS